MHTSLDTRTAAPTRYTPGPERAAVLADALGCIINGRPLPESLCAPSPARTRPATVEDGIRRIMDGGSTAVG